MGIVRPLAGCVVFFAVLDRKVSEMPVPIVAVLDVWVDAFALKGKCTRADLECTKLTVLCLWACMQASAVVDRIRRALATTSDNVSSRIGPIAKAFGNAFGVDDWCAIPMLTF